MGTMQHKIFCVREFIKTESATAVQRAFRLRFNIRCWNHQSEQIGCLCKGKSSDRPRDCVHLFESPCIFNNVKLLHVSVTSNHHQADISVHGHVMFSATVRDTILFTFNNNNNIFNCKWAVTRWQ